MIGTRVGRITLSIADLEGVLTSEGDHDRFDELLDILEEAHKKNPKEITIEIVEWRVSS
jgi:hypothetical protein